MTGRAYNILDGLGEALLTLSRRHSTSQQWAAWLKVPLQGAAAEGDLTMVETLMKAGASISGERERDGQTPLHAAAEGGSLNVVMALLRGRARRDVNKTTRGSRQTPLFCAVKRGHADVALALVRAGGDVDLADAHGWTPLMRASADGRPELVNNLLLNGACVGAKNKSGNRPLHYAVLKGHLGVVKLLLKAGALPSSRRKVDEKSSLELAVERGDTDVLAELLAAAPPSGPRDALYDGLQSALDTAAQGGHARAIDVLIDAGADVDVAYDGSDTPLHLACLHLQPDSVRTLLRRDACEAICNDDYDTPGDIVGHSVSEDRRDEEVVEWIREMLARAPADRVWRRRGWLAMLSARRRRAMEEEEMLLQQQLPQRKEAESHEQDGRRSSQVVESTGDQRDNALAAEAVCLPTVSRRKLSVGAGGEGGVGDDSAERVHPSLKRFHWMVTNMVEVADELIFRKIVSYL
eukprot:g10321.t1